MRKAVGFLAAVSVLAAALTAHASQPPQAAPVSPAPVASASLSSSRAAAHPVALTLTFSSVLRCGRPSASFTVTLPGAARIPASIARTAVLVAGKPAGAVHVSGRKVAITTAPAPHVLCDVIALGTVQIELGRAAGLGNPQQPGTYMVVVRGAGTLFSAQLHITA
jgi:hypothetical protein